MKIARLDRRIRAFLGEQKRAYDAPPPDSSPPPPTDRVQLGTQAKRLLDDPVLSLAFDLVERELMQTILNSPVGNTEEREAAYRLHWAAQEVRAKLRGMLGNAQMIAAEQKRQEQAAQRAAEREQRYN